MNDSNIKIPPVGENLKRERMARHLSLGALAETSGISKAMLSQIESGRVNPTLVTLWKAAHALSIDISILIDGQRKKPERFHLITSDQQACICSENGNTEFKILTAPGLPNELELYLIHLRPGSIHRSEPHEHGCGEYVLVTKGKIRVTCGSNSADLDTGDFLAYQGDLPHTLENIGAETAELQMTDFTPER